MVEIFYFSIALIGTAVGVALFRRYGTALGTFDIPNERSSHTSPVLRGGGIVIVAVCLSLYIAISHTVLGQANWGFIAGALIVAVVSWVDDMVSLPAAVKFVAHFAAAAVVVSVSAPIETVAFPGLGAFSAGPAVFRVFMVLWIVWIINAYNFMDGIDGIAGAQAVVGGLGWAVIGLWWGDQVAYLFGGAILFAGLGFLIHNWSPARVFMGDVGSAFCGYTFAAMPLVVSDGSPAIGSWFLPAAVSFLWMFIFDALFTLMRRVSRGERVWLAHREHLYQRLIIDGWGHASVAFIYAALTAIVAAAFILAAANGGSWLLLLLFTYLAAPMAVTFLASRKRV